MRARLLSACERQVEHLIEIAIVEIALPVDRDQAAAHDAVEIGVEVCVLQQLQVAVDLTPADEHRAEPLDRHVGEHEQAVEDDAVGLAKDALVFGLERRLRRRQRWALRIVDEVEDESLVAAVAERIKPLQPADRSVEHALAALALDIVGEIAGHRSDNFDLLGGEEGGEVFLARLRQDGEIASVHDAQAACTRAAHQSPEVRIEFGRPAGDVERADGAAVEHGEHEVGDVARHFLGAVRPGIDVAVHAALIAAVADIHLQRVETSALERREGDGVEQRQRVAHCGIPDVSGQCATRPGPGADNSA